MKKIFNEEVIKKIDQFEVNLPPDDWIALLAKTNAKRRIVPLWWYPVAATISIVLVIGILISISINTYYNGNVLIAKKFHYEQYHNTKKIIDKKNRDVIQSFKSITSEENYIATILTQRDSFNAKETFENNISGDIANIDCTENNSATDEDNTIAKEIDKHNVEKHVINSEKSLDDYAKDFIKEEDFRNEKSKDNHKNGSKKVFARDFYTFANSSVLPSKLDSRGVRDNNKILSSPNGGQSIISPLYSKTSHYLPVSAGIIVGIPIVDRLSISTGLQYTYLFSKTSNYENTSDVLVSTNEQNLHYLGVPISVNYKFLNKKIVQLYVSTGTTIDKGISKVDIYRYYENGVNMPDRQTEDKSKIKGLQMSINASLGASITIFKGFSLYVEPKISWYIPNAKNPQPTSKITTSPFLFNLSGGLRWDFGKK